MDLKEIPPAGALALMMVCLPLAVALLVVWVCAPAIMVSANDPAMRMLGAGAVGWLFGCLLGGAGMFAWAEARYG